MAEELTREEIYRALDALSKAVDRGFQNVNTRLDTMNGQVRTHGEEIAVLKDRGHRDLTARNASGASLLASGALFIWQKFFTP
jgi:pyrimidine operon attenuation protein/uracil phosphoribosyltransferase